MSHGFVSPTGTAPLRLLVLIRVRMVAAPRQGRLEVGTQARKDPQGPGKWIARWQRMIVSRDPQ
jgi:hypothetical protein